MHGCIGVWMSIYACVYGCTFLWGENLFFINNFYKIFFLWYIYSVEYFLWIVHSRKYILWVFIY